MNINIRNFHELVTSNQRLIGNQINHYKEIERHNKEEEKHQRFLREEINRKNRLEEISIIVSRDAVDEAEKWKKFRRELNDVSRGIAYSVSSLISKCISLNDYTGFREDISNSLSFNFFTDEEKMEHLIRHGHVGIMNFVVSALYVKYLVDKALSSGEPLDVGDNPTITLRGMAADDFLATKKYQFLPQDARGAFFNVVEDNIIRIPESRSQRDFRGTQYKTFLKECFSTHSRGEESTETTIRFPKEIIRGGMLSDNPKPRLFFERGVYEDIPKEVLKTGWDIIKSQCRVWSIYHY